MHHIYENVGGLGLTVDPHSHPDGLAGNELQPLIFKDALSRVELAKVIPLQPWCPDSLKNAIQERASVIQTSSAVDAYLGTSFLGSTEL